MVEKYPKLSDSDCASILVSGVADWLTRCRPERQAARLTYAAGMSDEEIVEAAEYWMAHWDWRAANVMFFEFDAGEYPSPHPHDS